MLQVPVEGFQLSPHQRYLWTLDSSSLTPLRSRCEVRIRGPLDVQALRDAIASVVARHEILRTTFYASSEMTMPVQTVGGDAPALRVIHISGAAPEERAARIDALKEDAARRSYDFGQGPLTNIAVASLDADEHLLLIDLPALCSDAGALQNLVVEIAERYGRQNADDATDDAAAECIQYIDASTWLNETLASDESAPGRDFWRHLDAGGLFRTQLPFERPVAGATPRVRRAAVDLPASVQARLGAIAGDVGGNIEAFLLTALHCLLQRATGRADIAIACVWSGREYAELEQAIGLFTRTLPVGGQLADDLPFAEAVRLVSERIACSRTWGACFDWSLVPDHQTGVPPAFAPLAVEHETWPAPYRTGDVEFELTECVSLADRFALKLIGRSRADGEIVFVEYDANRYDAEDVQRLCEQIGMVIDDALARPDCAIRDIRILPESQRHHLLALNRTNDASPAAAECIHHLFERAAERVPRTVAVVYEGEQLTYADLNLRANQLAHHLRARGVGPGAVVGLCLDRSATMMVGILGIMKAGGAYLPLDPKQPAPRLAAMIDDSATCVVVAEARFLDSLPTDRDIVMLDRDAAAIAGCQPGNPEGGAGPEDLAYVLFTSGSTGRPKGVGVEHRQLSHYVHAVRQRLGLPDAASFATVTTFAADLGNTSIYPALVSGGCLHIVSENRASDPQAFAAYQQQHRVDVVKIVPSHLKALLSCSEPHRLLPARRLVLGGEPCPWSLVDEVRRLSPELVVLNHYGPTETTVGATTYQVGPESRRELSATVPIGRPLPGGTTYVLDRNREMVPCWFPGELYIGGGGVSRGYVGSPTLTAERFIPDLHSGNGERLYKTGDQVRILPTGDLEFLGRRDHQVKIRGFRVELSEIEAALLRHAPVRQAVVLARHSEAAGQHLVACVVAASAAALDPNDLSAFLKSQLPDYMVPSAFVRVESLPLTPNGKIDRNAIADLVETPAGDASAAGEQPSGEWETCIAEIWREVLEVEHVGAHDNFYDLGGHSLMAIQVVTALEKRTRLHVSPRDLVFHTLRQFAALCASRASTAGE